MAGYDLPRYQTMTDAIQRTFLSFLLLIFLCGVQAQSDFQNQKIIVRRRVIIPNWNDRFQTGLQQTNLGRYKSLGPLARAISDQLKTNNPVLLNSRQVYLNTRTNSLDSTLLGASLYSTDPQIKRQPYEVSGRDTISDVYQLFTPESNPRLRTSTRPQDVPSFPQFRLPTLNSRARLSQAIRNIRVPFVTGIQPPQRSPTKWPYIVGNFEKPENFIRIPLKRDFLVENGKARQHLNKVDGSLDFPNYMPMKFGGGVANLNSNNLNLDSGADVSPLDNGVVYENSFQRSGPLQHDERERVYYDGRVFKKIRTKSNHDLKENSLNYLHEDFQRFLSLPFRNRQGLMKGEYGL